MIEKIAIQRACDLFGLTYEELTGTQRKTEMTMSRMFVAHLLKNHGTTLTRIAEVLRKHHSTIFYYVERIEDDLVIYPKTKAKYEKYESMVADEVEQHYEVVYAS